MLLRAATAIGGFDVMGFNKMLERLRAAEQRYEKATQESFAGLDIPGLLQEEWRNLIQAGDAYLKSLEVAEPYPVKGNRIPVLPPAANAGGGAPAYEVPGVLQQPVSRGTRQ